MSSGSVIDLSHVLALETPVFPGDPPVALEVLDATSWPKPDGTRALNCGRIATGLHTGTHMDAPFHFYGDGTTIERVPLEQCAGPALLVRLRDHGPLAEITPADLTPYAVALRGTGRVVLDTGWSRRWGQPEYFTEHPVLTGEAATFLLEHGVRLVGVDFPSVDRPPYPAHLALLGAGAVIVENLAHLDRIVAGRFTLVALPLPIAGRDGSPVRAVAIVE